MPTLMVKLLTYFEDCQLFCICYCMGILLSKLIMYTAVIRQCDFEKSIWNQANVYQTKICLSTGKKKQPNKIKIRITLVSIIYQYLVLNIYSPFNYWIFLECYVLKQFTSAIIFSRQSLPDNNLKIAMSLDYFKI